MASFKPKTILYVPDAHVMAGDDLKRFYALKHWLADRRVKLDHMVQGGDLWDFAAFCSYDEGRPEYYERHFWKEFSRGLDALDILESLATLNGNPGCKFSLTEGNHENRYAKVMAADNRLRTGPFPKTVAELVKFYRPASKVNYVEFLKPLQLYGITFAHYFTSGLMGRPQGGERPASNILKAQFQSAICCHSHLKDTAERTCADGRKIHCLVGGCFVNPKHKFAFAGPAQKLWHSCVHLLHVTAPGEFDTETISAIRLGG